MRTAIRQSLSVAALLLVAAPLRAGTLKVPAQFETIQAAVDAAITGDVVQVAKGVYRENVTVSTAGITLKGKGATIDGAYLGNCLVVTANDVQIDGFTLVNGGFPPSNGGGAGGLACNGTGAVFTKLTIRSCHDFGIFLQGTGDVESCTVSQCLGSGIVLNTNDPLGSVTSSISKNTVTECGDGIIALSGPCTVESNTCEQNDGTGVLVNIAPLEGLDILPTTVSKNKTRYNGEEGLNLSVLAGPQCVVDKNTSEFNNVGARIVGFNMMVTGNTFDDNRHGGLLAEVSNGFVLKCKVRDNGLFGIRVLGVAVVDDGASLAGVNLVEQNTVQGNGGDGISVESEQNQIHKNTVKDNAGDGVSIAATQAENQVTDNTVTANVHDGIDNSGIGTVIAGNKCTDNGGADIAGAGDGSGTVSAADSTGNKVSDDSDIVDFTTTGELELATD